MNKLTFALIGNPNCGKTTLFNSLTGSHLYVGNWAGVTVEKKIGKIITDDYEIDLVDLPGIYSLTPYSDEEKISRDFLLSKDVDLVINVIDSTSIERNLYLTTQLLEMNIPIVLALNMEDELLKKGEKIDIQKLEDIFKVKAIEISALKKENLSDLIKLAISESSIKRDPWSVIDNKETNTLITAGKDIYKDKENSLYHSIKALEEDSIEKDLNPIEYQECNKLNKNEDFIQFEANIRYEFITDNLNKFLSIKESENATISDKIDKIVLNKYACIPIVFLIIFLMFELTFSHDLLFLNAFKAFKGGLNSPLNILASGEGINSPGVILSNLVSFLCNLFTDLFRNIILVQAPYFLRSLICDGIFQGFFTLLSILPQILFLYMLFSILEDSGYMARIAFMLDRIFRPFGISGRAIIPLIMGFGCSVTAILNCRTLDSKKEKTKVIRAIPFFTCSAKTTIVTTICSILLTSFNIKLSSLILYGIYALGVIISFLSIYVMNKTTQRDSSQSFVMELPDYHLPQAGSLFQHVFQKAKSFVKKASTIIVLSNLFIWLFMRLSFSMQYLGKEAYLQTNINGNDYCSIISMKNIAEEQIKTLIQNGIVTSDKKYILSNAITSIDKNNLTIIFNDESIVLEGIKLKSTEIITNPENSILGSFGQLLSVFLTPLGLGLKTPYTPHIKGNTFVFPLSIISGIVAKENVITTLTNVSSSISQNNLLPNMIVAQTEKTPIENLLLQVFENENGVFTYKTNTIASLISFTLVNLTTLPCVASISATKSELNNKKNFKYTILFWLVLSYIVGAISYMVISYTWTIPIVLAVLILSLLTIHFVCKFLDKKKKEKYC